MQPQTPSYYPRQTLRQVEREAYPTIREMQREAVRLVPRRQPRTWLADRFNRKGKP
jgi:hypothetical protein